MPRDATLFSRADVIVLAVANNPCRLPRVMVGQLVETVDTYENASDFRLIARLTQEIQHRDISDVIMVTADKALARAVQAFVNQHYINCQCYPNVAQELMSDKLMHTMSSTRLTGEQTISFATQEVSVCLRG